jgi:hypothetical protein
MPSADSWCARLLRHSSIAVAFGCALAPTPALADIGPKPDGPLSAGLTELAKPALRSASPARQAAVLGVAPSGPGSLLREGSRVFVTVRFDSGAIARLGALRALGARVVSSSRRYQTVTVAATPAILRELAAVPGVGSVSEALAPIAYGSAATAVGVETACEGGSVISEGLSQLRVDEAREAFGLRGKGTTVGVLSDSFDRATQAADGSGPVATHAKGDVESGDLPGPVGTCSGQQVPVNVLDDGAPGGESADEGRAMLQIVHDLAPHASLAFATAFKSEESFAQNIERLARPVAAGGAGAQVIVDDVGYFDEPFFQDGPVAAAINKVTAEGVTYLSAAGNDNLFEGENEIASWEAPEYRDSEGCPKAIEELAGFNGSHCMDFDPGPGTDRTFGLTVEAGQTLLVDLQWSEPWFGVNTDLDAFLLNGGGQVIEASVEGNTGKNGTQKPVEIVEWENKSASAVTVNLAVNRFEGVSPRLKFVLLENGRGVTKTEYPKSAEGDVVGPTIFGHAGAASAIALAAVRYNDSSKPERYSSRGPVTHYFEAVDGSTPAAALGSPETVLKPDVAATDCGATTFFARQEAGVWRFCGTSAAAPHAAAVATLLRQGDPFASAGQIRSSLTETAAAVGSFPPAAVGSGLIDAVAAVEDLPELVEPEDPPSTVVPPLEVEPQPPTPSVQPLPPPPPPAVAPPSTFFASHPPKVVRTTRMSSRLSFRFGSGQAGVTFLCKIDRAAFRVCGARLSRTFAIGSHVIEVKAQNAAGVVDASPAVFRFRVKRIG